MNTIHKLIIGSSVNLSTIKDKSVALIVTSPPYPMIEMWDECFLNQDTSIDFSKPMDAFEKMHVILDAVWKECDRVLIDGGFACINIGDAVRTINDIFQMYSNHSRIITFFSQMGYSVLPDIHWRKPSNAPNKFMGSGMYPAGAYVTYEHEYILIFRKGGKRIFTAEEKLLRQQSAYFWEERNEWFSDLWEIKGEKQRLNCNDLRERSAAFPFEIPYRLISMYSIKGDTVLDPFGGTGITSIACMALERNSVYCEYDSNFKDKVIEKMLKSLKAINKCVENRIDRHEKFLKNLNDEKKLKCYKNDSLGMLVKTKQEMKMEISYLDKIYKKDDTIIVSSKPTFVENERRRYRSNLLPYLND